MLWAVLVIVAMILAFCMESKAGKVVLSAGVIALGCLFLDLITGMDLFILLAQLCAIVVVVIIIAVIVLAIIGS